MGAAVYLNTICWQAVEFYLLTITPASGFQPSYCMYLAVSRAAFSPYILETTCSAPSIPADTPAVVITFPLSTQRTSERTSVCGASFLNRSIAPYQVVAFFPSSTPALAKMKAPVQTEKAIWSLLLFFLTHAITSRLSTDAFVPPPGRTSISGLGQS